MTKTSRATKSDGFSLIEILITLSLVALIMGFAVPSLVGVFRESNESFVRRLALTLREGRDRAMLMSKLLRLRVDLDQQQVWLEEAPDNYMLPKSAAEKELSEREKEEKKKTEGETFREVTELMPKHLSLPTSLKLVELVGPRWKGSVQEGIADVYFYSNGSSDGASLHFETEEKVRLSIVLHPVTGQSKVVTGFTEGKR